MFEVLDNLTNRLKRHDLSKLESPEKEAFDRATELKGMTYGSIEYKDALNALGPALQHHYDHNSHHPQFHKDGIEGMSLLDLIEMLADWKAAGERHADGSMVRSLELNKDRFHIPSALQKVLEITAKELHWV
jgi:hypothetical protein